MRSASGLHPCGSYGKSYQAKSGGTDRQRYLAPVSGRWDSVDYHQFYAADANRTLLRAMHLIHQAEQRGQDPSEFLNKVLGVPGDSWFERSENVRSLPSRTESLADETLRANYEHCRKLGLLDNADALDDLADGELPVICTGPATGQRVVISTVIDPELSPGIEKVLANLEITPPKEPSLNLGDVEIAAARRLARDLQNAGVIEQQALKRILARYDQLAPN